MSGHSSRHIRLSTSLVTLAIVFFPSAVLPTGNAIQQILREQIIAGGFTRSEKLYQNPDAELAHVGKTIFESKRLSLNGNISCRTCHQDRFGSADGIPNAAAIGGTGVGPNRLLSGAKLLPRKTLAFWGRGGKHFDAFFWDGRVSFANGKIISQFGSSPPSKDLLVTADHLPVVQIREMLDDYDPFVGMHKQESVLDARAVYRAIAGNLKKGEPAAARRLATYLKKSPDDLTYTDFARSLAAFIRSEFRLRSTRLERFTFGTGSLTEHELKGALVFYGNGRCITCHSGPYFSDFKYHVVAFPQLGFGSNGFGIDYGRYNVTFNTRDLYRFRTPPLFNVEKTRPYGHSGSAASLKDAIIAHFDPLSLVNLGKMSPLQRNVFYKRLSLSGETASRVGFISSEDVADLESFLRTLSFEQHQ